MDAVEVAPKPDVSPDTVRAAMTDVDALGGFFAVAVGTAPDGERWRPVAELYGPPGPGDVLDARIGEVAGQLGASRRVAASLLGLSLTARASAIVLATVVEHGVLPLLGDDRLCWRPWPGGPLPLWIADPAGHAVGAPDDGATADVVAAELDRVHLRPLVAAIRARESVSEQVLWGNAASSLAGAVRVLALERPHARDAARALAEGLLARAPFAGLGAFVAEPSHPTGFGFLRTTCCLFHRVPGGGTCGDCVLEG